MYVCPPFGNLAIIIIAAAAVSSSIIMDSEIREAKKENKTPSKQFIQIINSEKKQMKKTRRKSEADQSQFENEGEREYK